MTDLTALSYGGGVQSTAMLVLAARGDLPDRLALFCNVGDDSEHPATIAYVRDHAAPYCEANGIELVTLGGARPTSKTLYQRLTAEGSRSIGIPVRMNNSGAPGRRACTVDYKVRRVARELKRRGATKDNPATVSLGISLDEYGRMRTDSGIPWERLAYPLVDLRLTRQDCVNVIESAGLPVPPKSSCWFCPFHSRGYWRAQRDTEPELFAKSVALERLLNERRAALRRDPVWLTGSLRPLDEWLGTDRQPGLWDDAASCDSGGYCHA